MAEEYKIEGLWKTVLKIPIQDVFDTLTYAEKRKFLDKNADRLSNDKLLSEFHRRNLKFMLEDDLCEYKIVPNNE